MNTCPYGGSCIDPGSPSDCYANDRCVNFTSVDERKAFDAQPDKFYFRYAEGGEIRLKNENQLRFLLADLPQKVKDGGEWGTINKGDFKEY
jgi:hypothetical protein